MEREIFMTKVNAIFLGLTPTSHLVGHVMDITKVLTTFLVDLSSTRGIFTSCQTLEGYFMGVPTIINLAFDHEVQNSPGQKLVITTEVKVI